MLTGPDAPGADCLIVSDGTKTTVTDRRFAVSGTDLGVMWESRPGEILCAFGDTFSPSSGGDFLGPDWRCNVIGRSTGRDMSKVTPLEFITDRPRHAKQCVPGGRNTAYFPGEQEVTVIPTGAVAIDGRQFMAYFSMNQWGGWNTWRAGLAYSDDFGVTWTRKIGSSWANNAANDQRFQMPALLYADGWLYLVGTMTNRKGPAYLARVLPKDALDPANFRYWDGKTFQPDERKSVPIFDGRVGELSVMFHRKSRRFLASYVDNGTGRMILRDAATLTGPWSKHETGVTSRDYPQLYGAFLHPWSMDSDTVKVAMSQWGPYNVHEFELELRRKNELGF